MVRVNIITPFAVDRNIGREYNRMIRNLPDGEWVCILDADVLFLTPDTGNILHGYAELNPGCVLTALTNRIHPNSPQLFGGKVSSNTQINQHIEVAEQVQLNCYQTENILTTISGFLMLFEKSMWEKFPFSEGDRILGVDSDWSQKLQEAGVPVKLMLGCYVFHSYRLKKGIHNKSHLL